jgi:hypothetical protein
VGQKNMRQAGLLKVEPMGSPEMEARGGAHRSPWRRKGGGHAGGRREGGGGAGGRSIPGQSTPCRRPCSPVAAAKVAIVSDLGRERGREFG